MDRLNTLREQIRTRHVADDGQVLTMLGLEGPISGEQRERAHLRAIDLIDRLRADEAPALLEVFLAEYGLTNDEGIALMCLAEALPRVPDTATIDELIEDKIAPSAWGQHLGQSSSVLVNASTWALMLTGKVLDDEGEGIAATLRGAVKRLGEPVIRAAVKAAIRELGRQFVLGETIEDALKRGEDDARKGYLFSFDMLGEAAVTRADADGYYQAYAHAIDVLAQNATSDDPRRNPGISIKLSALHPRYEQSQRDRVMRELVGSTLNLVRKAKAANLGLNIDAEESERLDLSLDVIAGVLAAPDLAGWDGFGVVVQAYGKRASPVLDWLYALAETLDRKIMVRLVKGAYWDSEIKRAQVEGLAGFPVFARKSSTDMSFMACAAKLAMMSDRIYPQFATHNAHTLSAVMEICAGVPYEVQRLHGMGENLHALVQEQTDAPCRIYAPVGSHRDLLAYLVRRLLENGANSSFVNQLADLDVPSFEIAADPFGQLWSATGHPEFHLPKDLFTPERRNSRGWDLASPADISSFKTSRSQYARKVWDITSEGARTIVPVSNPARPDDIVGHIPFATQEDVALMVERAQVWEATHQSRSAVLRRAADLFEDASGQFFALLAREAGKTAMDAVGEIREAVDFIRFYAMQARHLQSPALGVVACISPWNFPLAIFTGQIVGALAAGNAVIAKPAEETPLVAQLAINLLHAAGVPKGTLRLAPGLGEEVGAALSTHKGIGGICFTGSTDTARLINRAMARHQDPGAVLIAETGGINAMIVDSTALLEQAVADVIASAFQSAGQRCSACRMVYLQQEIYDEFVTMLSGAMDELSVGDPWNLDVDVGPIITAQAQHQIQTYVDAAAADDRLIKQLKVPTNGHFVGPALLRVGAIGEITEEIFGPVLHVAPYAAQDLGGVIEQINALGFGLTFGIHSRIDDRVEFATSRINAGNIYVNRNQIGAVVGSQPFGGEGLSGTGPKAGGPAYVARLTRKRRPFHRLDELAPPARAATVQAVINQGAGLGNRKLDELACPGPTGESNRLYRFGRGTILCLGPTADAARTQARAVERAGALPVLVAPGLHRGEGIDGWLDPTELKAIEGIHGVASWADPETLRAIRIALADRDGPIIPLMCEDNIQEMAIKERHICIDTTAAGGNTELLAQSDETSG